MWSRSGCRRPASAASTRLVPKAMAILAAQPTDVVKVRMQAAGKRGQCKVSTKALAILAAQPTDVVKVRMQAAGKRGQ